METEIEAENPTQANPSRDVDLMTLVLRLRAGHIPRPADSELTMEEAADVIESLLARLKVIAADAGAVRDDWLDEQPPGIGLVIRNIRKHAFNPPNAVAEGREPPSNINTTDAP